MALQGAFTGSLADVDICASTTGRESRTRTSCETILPGVKLLPQSACTWHRHADANTLGRVHVGIFHQHGSETFDIGADRAMH